jgi:hypothetical protein
MKESYRLNKQTLTNWCLFQKKHLKIAFIYISSEPSDFLTIEESTIKLMEEIINPKETNNLRG